MAYDQVLSKSTGSESNNRSIHGGTPFEAGRRANISNWFAANSESV